MQFDIVLQEVLEFCLGPGHVMDLLNSNDIGRRSVIGDEWRSTDELTRAKLVYRSPIGHYSSFSRTDHHQPIQLVALSDKTLLWIGILPAAQLEQLQHLPRCQAAEHQLVQAQVIASQLDGSTFDQKADNPDDIEAGK